MRPRRRSLALLGILILLLSMTVVACQDNGTPEQTGEATQAADPTTAFEEGSSEELDTSTEEAPAEEAAPTEEAAAPEEVAPTEEAEAAEATPATDPPVTAAPADLAIPFLAEWSASPHNDATSEAFNHRNEEDPAEVPTDCARCHSTPGYVDYVGADGSEPNVVNAPAPIGTTVQCEACHNTATIVKTSVIFPSGIEVQNLGDESRCMVCHQGRASTVSVDTQIADAGLAEDLDTVSEDLGFTNIHYYAAAATQYGTPDTARG